MAKTGERDHQIYFEIFWKRERERQPSDLFWKYSGNILEERERETIRLFGNILEIFWKRERERDRQIVWKDSGNILEERERERPSDCLEIFWKYSGRER